MNKKIINILCIFIEILLLLLFAFKTFKPNEKLNIPFESWETDSSESSTISSPYFFIGKGSYLLTVSYSADSDASFSVASDADNSYNLETYTTVLHSQKHNEQIQFEASGPVDNTKATFSSEGELNIKDVNIYRTHNPENRLFVCLLFIIICCNIFIFNKEVVVQQRGKQEQHLLKVV